MQRRPRRYVNRTKAIAIEAPIDSSTKPIDGERTNTFSRRPFRLFPGRDYVLALAVVAFCSLLCWLSETRELADVNGVMIYLAGVAFIAARFGHGPAIMSAFLSVVAYLYLFIPPIFGFSATDTQYFFVLTVMLGIALLISELTARLRSQLRAAQQREQRTAQLHKMTLQLNEHLGVEALVSAAGRYITKIFGSEVAIYLRQLDHSLGLCFGQEGTFNVDPQHFQALNRVAAKNEPAGVGTQMFEHSSAYYVPMIGSQNTIGVLATRRSDSDSQLDLEHRSMLATCANLLALSIERDQSRAEVQAAQVQIHTEQLRNSLLSAVSHDLRTPLATIAVSASSLLQEDAAADANLRREKLQVVVDESGRLARQVDNLLEMARLNSGTLVVKRDWHVLEELVGVAVGRLRRELSEYTIVVEIPDDFPLLWVADDLIVQILVNLLDNAVRYTPPGCRIEITAVRHEDHVQIRLADDGPGLQPGCEERIFDKFFRASNVVADGQRGMGLGLTICRSIVELHGGDVTAVNRPQGGAEFIVSLPCPAHSPLMSTGKSMANNG